MLLVLRPEAVSSEKDLTGGAVVAGSADLVDVSVSYTVSDLDGVDTGADSLDDTDTLVAENLVGLQVVLVGTAETGVSGLDEDIVVAKSAGDLVRDDLALLGAAENLVSDAHFGDVIWKNLEKKNA